MMRYTEVKVFTATKARDRAELGEEITLWLASLPSRKRIVDKRVLQSSDAEFHCLTVIFFLALSRRCPAREGDGRTGVQCDKFEGHKGEHEIFKNPDLKWDHVWEDDDDVPDTEPIF